MTFSKPAIIGWVLFFASVLLWVDQAAYRRGYSRAIMSNEKSERMIQKYSASSERTDSLRAEYYYSIGYRRGRAGLPEEGWR